jgi:hypothetical protein
VVNANVNYIQNRSMINIINYTNIYKFCIQTQFYTTKRYTSSKSWISYASNITKRASNSLHHSTNTTVIRPSLSSQPRRDYATYKACKPEAKTTDPKSLHNNPPITKKSGNSMRHREVHRERCIENDCSKKICSSLCDDFQDKKAVGHFTHGQIPPSESGKTFIPNISSTDMDGNNKPESLVIYHDAHDTSSTAEIINGTVRINTDPAIQNAIIKHADNK